MYALWYVSEIFSSCDDKANFMEMLYTYAHEEDAG